ncbi:MAG TPA: efflux RND transporter periplasmic adaptor subunit [Gammaproteobacteria bacterium]
MRKQKEPGWVAPAGALLLALALAGCEQQVAQEAPPPVAVSFLEVVPTELPLELEYAAQLRGIREVEVRARVSGILLERLYDEGEAVKAGDVLFKIDPAPFQAEVERARAELGVRLANLRAAERERDRILPLYEQQVASLRDRDNAVTAYETARAAVAAAEAALRTAELSLSYTDVRAPIDGLTSREVRSEGSLVTAGDDSSLLTYIVQTDRLYVEFAVPEADAELVRKALAKHPDDVAVQVVRSGGVVHPGKARIEFIAPRVDDATGTVAVRAVLENGDGTLLPGHVARARIEGVGISDALVIPRRALMHGAQGTFVWRIDETGAVAPQPVEVGLSAGNDAIVTSGLASGDRIVVDGTIKVYPGAVVQATPVGAQAGAAPAQGSL